MPTPATIAAVTAKFETPAGAETAPDAPADASPAGGAASGAVSAPAGNTAALPTAPTTEGAATGAPTPPAIDHADLEAKLARDRELRAARDEKKRAKVAADAAEAAKKEAEAARARWATLGKDGSIIDTLREAGRDPREVFEAMKAEALKAGTPEAQIEKVTKLFETKITTLEQELKAEREAREATQKAHEQQQRRAATEAATRGFHRDFEAECKTPEFASLLEEYEPEQLLNIAETMKNEPERLVAQVQRLKLDMPNLTAPDGRFNMKDIFRVLKATQDEHFARMQRRKQSAAPQTSSPSPQQPAAASKPTVNGTAERKPPTTIGNDLASSSASEAEQLKNMTFEQRKAYLAKKYA
jgi:hypothetical protein